MPTLFEQKTKLQLVQAATAYSRLIGRSFVIESDAFVRQKRYVMRFFETNFLHLSGVETDLSPREFYAKCFSGDIEYGEFWDSPKKNASTIKKKLANLVLIDSFFDADIYVQEDFKKGLVRCFVATSNGQCTLGFVDAKYYVRPNTILASNHLDPSKPIVRVKPFLAE